MNLSINGLKGFSIFSQKFGTAGMLKSTQDKLERQQKAQSQIEFFENQKENLKNMQCDSIEDIVRKLEMFHSYEDQIAAVKKQYNNEQMFHTMDEARERGEQIAELAEDYAPKTEEERKEEMVEEALGIEEKGGLTESMEEVQEITEEMVDKSAESKAQKILSEKFSNAVDGEIYLNETDMKPILQTIRAEEQEKTKPEPGVGMNLDLKI